MKYQISKQKLDKLTLHFDGETFFGVYQTWYPLFWQRLAGCGPSCASNLLACIDDNTKFDTKENCILTMRAMWKHVTPGLRGLNKVEKFTKGSIAFFAEHNMPYTCKYTKCQPNDKKSLAEAIDFIKQSLQNNQPVAFLNLSNGDIKELERWHWVTVVALEQTDNDCIVTIFDADQRFDMSMNLWNKTATNPAGFACFDFVK